MGPYKHSQILFANYFNGCYDQTIRVCCLFQNLQPYNSQFLSVHRSRDQGKGLNLYFFYAVLNMTNVALYFYFFYVVLDITNVASYFHLFYVVLNTTNVVPNFDFFYVVLNIKGEETKK